MLILGTQTPFTLFEDAVHEGLRLERDSADALACSPEVRAAEISAAYDSETCWWRHRHVLTSIRLELLGVLAGRHLYWEHKNLPAFQLGPGLAEFAAALRSRLLEKAPTEEYQHLTGEDPFGDY